MNIKSGKIESFESYSQFGSLKDFNNHVEMWMVDCKKEFTKGELVGLKRLVRYAAKIPGVCNAKIGTILKAIHEEYDNNGISRSTFKRMVQKAATLGMITVHETERRNGSQSSNLYVFNRYSDTNEPPKTKEMNHPIKTIIPSETIDYKKERTDEIELDETFTNEEVPNEFVSLVKSFYPAANIIEEYWKMTKIAAYRNNREHEIVDVLPLSIQAFKQMIQKMRNGRVKNPFAYYYGILNKKLETLYFEELTECKDSEQNDDETVFTELLFNERFALFSRFLLS